MIIKIQLHEPIEIHRYRLCLHIYLYLQLAIFFCINVTINEILAEAKY